MSFTDRLDGVPLPKGFILPQLTQFNGTGDPIKHLQGFLAKMTITSNDPDIYAKFGSAIQAYQDERELMDIQQGPNESLRSYHKGYTDILLTIPEVKNKIAYMAFYLGLTYGKLKKALIQETPLSKDESTARERQYVELEELKNEEGQNKDLRDGLVRCTQRAVADGLIPLRVSIAEVYFQIKGKNLLPKSVRMRSAVGRRDKTRYCEYHREHGHDTNECRILNAEIEKLIKRGYLKEFMGKGTQRDPMRQNRRSPLPDNRPRIKQEPQEVPQIIGRIHTISGGIAGGGNSRNSRKNYARREVYSLNQAIKLRSEIISFSDKELTEIELPHDDLVVIAPIIENFIVERMLVDIGTSADILYLRTFDKLQLLRRAGTKVSTIRAQFTVVYIVDASYNGLIGRPILTALRGIVSPVHLKMKFLTPGGIGEVCGDQKRARICYQTSVPPLNKGLSGQDRKRSRENHMKINTVKKEDGEENLPRERESEKQFIPHEEVPIVPFKQENKEKNLLNRLYVDLTFSPIKQKKRLFNEKKNLAIREEVQTLLKAQAIHELKFPPWIANLVLIKNPNEKWRMCIDFTSLNKACSKDFYPLPCLGLLVDGSTGHEVFDFWTLLGDITKFA
ncbi:hypothetical protein LIER_36888 [Lithospermum erythrorhizon]|uniref:Uncharacterized protein n=1 Tax=Lithospermum erythrorhizon TaxID=34254 RepID=A0AAV3PD80_LITER